MKFFSKIDRMKRKAKRLANSLDRQLDEVDCGRNILGMTRPSFREQAYEYDDTIAWLRDNDPKFGSTS